MMLFGFRGHWTAKLDYEANGIVASTNREFYIQGAQYPRTNPRNERHGIKFDVDDVSAVEPSVLLNRTNIANDGRQWIDFTEFTLLVRSINFPAIGLVPYGPIAYYVNAFIGWRYTSNAALIPPTRKYRAMYPRPDLQIYQGIMDIAVTGSNAAGSNLAVGSPLIIDLRIFINLKHITINSTFASIVEFKFPPKIESLQWTHSVVGSNPTAINGKLPATIKSLVLGHIGTVSNIDTLIQDCINIEALYFALFSGTSMAGTSNPTTSLTGTLNLSHLIKLKYFLITQNSGLTTITFPSGKSDWLWISVFTVFITATVITARLDEMLASPGLQVFQFVDTRISWARNFTDIDFPASMLAFNINKNSIVGNITITNPKPNIKEFRTGNQTLRVSPQLNSHPVMNLSGLTGTTVIDITGSDVQDLTLPVNTVCVTLWAYDNKLDIVTNPNLATQINAMTALQSLQLGHPTQGQGQNSVNGFGANVNFSGLVNCTLMSISNCKFTGTLTVPNLNKINEFRSFNNPGLNTIVNIGAHINMATLTISECVSLNMAFHTFASLTNLNAVHTGVTLADLTGRTSTANIFTFQFEQCANLTEIRIPSAANAAKVVGDFRIIQNPVLATILNETNLDYTVQAAASTRRFTCSDNAILNRIFSFGTNNYLPGTIYLFNNAMNTANLDATINNNYINRAKNWGTGTKVLNIAGAGNGVPTGTFQAPPGFVLGSNDGSPGNAKEQAYVLVNNYAWSITMN